MFRIPRAKVSDDLAGSPVRRANQAPQIAEQPFLRRFGQTSRSGFPYVLEQTAQPPTIRIGKGAEELAQGGLALGNEAVSPRLGLVKLPSQQLLLRTTGFERFLNGGHFHRAHQFADILLLTAQRATFGETAGLFYCGAKRVRQRHLRQLLCRKLHQRLAELLQRQHFPFALGFAGRVRSRVF